MKLDIKNKLVSALDKLNKAPLKPQRFFGLRTMILRGIFHQAELGNVNISVLHKCDQQVRCKVRQRLSLPSDAPN
ncbi:reverse transcriptase [Lasius niger]|uniref:Reverse transcriptase n=2 Tax=Lasius TaxID=488720 RepID=A0A0J7K1K8_LASNI|nr:reverse transcriptase [Lasius niger]